MRDYEPHEIITDQTDNFLEWWEGLTPEQRPPGVNMKNILSYVVENTVLPEVVYRIDQVVWLDQNNWSEPTKTAFLPYRKDPSKADSPWNSLRLHFTIYAPHGTRKAWKIVCQLGNLHDVLKRFRLETDSRAVNEAVEEMMKIPYLNGKGKRYRPYPTEEAAQEAVGRFLLKIGLVRPLRDVDEMHEIHDYDS
jgi:hypothetical protein